jgi:hypothetical protein
MDIEQALSFIDIKIRPVSLNNLQELVFRGCWEKKTYQEIATESGYDHDYIRVIGYELWKQLSDTFATKVTKNNFRSILRQEKNSLENASELPEFLIKIPPVEVPEGTVSLDSPFYIERPPIEEYSYQEIQRDGALIRLRGSSKMGKTSLKNRILAYANNLNYHTVTINFKQADETILQDLDKFLRWFCANIAHQLGLKAMLNDYWNEDIGSKVSCTIYFQQHILTSLTQPLVIGLDEINILWEYPKIAQHFLPLLRSWYEEAKDLRVWQKLRLVICNATEFYIPLDINQSPFNVGLCLKLPEFTPKQVTNLAKLHGLNWKEEQEVSQLMKVIGGHPYLVRLAFYHLINDNLSLNKLLDEAATLSGIYSKYLRFHWQILEENIELMNAIQEVITTNDKIKLEPIIAYKLETMGLVKLNKDNITISCQLYHSYFLSQLK